MKRKLFSIMSFMLIFVVMLTACAPTEVVKTVEVVKEVVRQIARGLSPTGTAVMTWLVAASITLTLSVS